MEVNICLGKIYTEPKVTNLGKNCTSYRVGLNACVYKRTHTHKRLIKQIHFYMDRR